MNKTSILFLLLLFMSTSVVFGQAGTTVIYQDNLSGGNLTLTYDGLVNGKHSYSESGSGDNITISWSGTRWEVICCSGLLLSHSDAVTTLNPPNSAVGAYVIDDPASGTPIITGSGTTGVILPVELINFIVVEKDKSLELQWQTASELNNEKFEIEMSEDGETFQKLGEVKGNGSFTIQNDYSFAIMEPYIGLSYYRLKQIDFDGQFEYSDIVSARFERIDASSGMIYPNPSRLGLVNMDLSSEASKLILISVFDVSGNLVTDQIRSLEKGINHLNFDFSSLEKGIYILKLGDDESSNYSKLILN